MVIIETGNAISQPQSAIVKKYLSGEPSTLLVRDTPFQNRKAGSEALSESSDQENNKYPIPLASHSHGFKNQQDKTSRNEAENEISQSESQEVKKEHTETHNLNHVKNYLQVAFHSQEPNNQQEKILLGPEAENDISLSHSQVFKKGLCDELSTLQGHQLLATN